MSRPTFIDVMFSLADVWSRRSTCPRLAAACVLVNDDWQVLASGYNGAPRGLEHCDDVGCLIIDGHCQRALHSEWNAIIQAARVGVSIKGAKAFITARPCQICMKMLIQAGVSEVHYWAPYSTDAIADQVERLAQAAGIPLLGPYRES